MTLEDIYETLDATGMIKVDETVQMRTIVRPKPRRGRPPKIPRPIEYIVEEVPVDKVKDKDDMTTIPSHFDIVPDMALVETVLAKHNAKGYLTLKPERLKYTPFLVTRDPIAAPAPIDTAQDDNVHPHHRGAPSETPSSGNKEVIATPLDSDVAPMTPTPKDKIVAGEDQATLDLVAALSASPVRHLRRRSLPSAEQPAKRRRRSEVQTPTPTRRRASAAGGHRRRFVDPDEEWSDEDAEGEDDDYEPDE
jgi:hypothetical protein